ncbi:MAG: DUF421 domain-containing protein [Bacillota bacterium]
MSFWEQVLYSSPGITLTGYILRAVIAYLFLLLILRLTGQRELGRLGALDFVVAITIGSIAGSASQSPFIGLLPVLIGIGTWGGMHILVTWLGMRFPSVHRLTEGRPIVLINKGKLQELAMAKQRINLDDLMEELRQKGAPRLADVEYAVLEPSGRISVLKQPERMPLTAADLKLEPGSGGLPNVLVMNGKAIMENLQDSGHSEGWLRARLAEAGARSITDVAVAQLDADGNLYVDLRDDVRPQPKSTNKAATISQLKCAAADLESFALETDDEAAKRMYADNAMRLRELVATLRPHLLTAKEYADGKTAAADIREGRE